ncbi:S-adenosyl-L-methionine-dependent methyltransferase, partial [Lentinula detonsa]
PRLSHRNTASSSIELTPVLSPNVHRIAKKFFRNTFEVIGPDLSNKDPLEQENPTEYTSHPGIPGTMKWGKKLAVEEDKVFYKTITMDGELYKAGDVVMVEPGEDDRKGRQGNYKSQPSQSSNGNANRFWFIQICYFFEDVDDGSKQFHGRWLEHGSKTFLQETAHSRELFLTNACADAPATSIYRKCDMKFLGLAEREPEDDTSYEGNSYFCQYTWLDLDDPTFASLPQPEEVEADLMFAPDYRRCHSCVLAERMEQQRLVHHSGNCISQFGVDYHVGDFVYLRPSKLDNEQLEIAQIVGLPSPALNTVTIKVHMLCHVATRPNTEETFADEVKETTPFDRVDGKCFVSYFPQPDAEGFKEWIKEKDHFYVLDSRKFEQCTRCMEEHETQLAMYRDFLAQEGPLSMLELFSGAGGLGTGLDQSNFVKTAAAVEFDRYAAETYQINHPDTTVYCKDVIELLRGLEDGDDVKSLNGKPFPKPGDIDIIAGGPPCQAFSGANHNRIVCRATLPFVMLSYAELYLPKYFLLENVVGLLRHRLLGLLQGRSIVDGIQHGVFKLITRILLALGYQVRVKVLQAANFGAPQSRERIIFLGARQGLKLPEFPMPTHAYSAQEHRLLEHADLKLCRSTRSRDPSRPHFFAPFRAVTVNDAIGDLPAFDWKNPHQIIPIKDKDIQERKVRNIRCFEATHTPGRDLPGFLSAEYAHPPMNYFQQRIREGMHNVVEEQVTPMYSPLIVERCGFCLCRVAVILILSSTTTVPLKPGASLKGIYISTHGRLHPNQCFRTVLTHCNPGAKNSVLLHHSQKRIITAREVSRCQGFPDRYIFLKADDLKDDIRRVRRAYKQIGNAVPVPLALALGQSLSDALI